jgi:hypothetical protein
LRSWPAPSRRAQRHRLQGVDHEPTHSPLFPLVFRMKYAWRTGWGGSGKSRGTPLWKPRSTASRHLWPGSWKSGGMISGAMRWNPWVARTSLCGR